MSETTPTKQKKQALEKEMEELYGSSAAQYWLPDQQEVPVEDLLFDEDAREGQIRVLEADSLEKRVQSFRTVEPQTLIDVCLWEADAAGVEFLQCTWVANHSFSSPGSKKVVIAGQHSVKALMILRDERIKDNKDIKPWMQKVKARVLQYDTPVDVRRQVAGDNQFIQRNVNDVKISDWCRLFLESDANLSFMQRLAQAVRQAGYDRPPTPVCNIFFKPSNSHFFFPCRRRWRRSGGRWGGSSWMWARRARPASSTWRDDLRSTTPSCESSGAS